MMMQWSTRGDWKRETWHRETIKIVGQVSQFQRPRLHKLWSQGSQSTNC